MTRFVAQRSPGFESRTRQDDYGQESGACKAIGGHCKKDDRQQVKDKGSLLSG